MTSAYLTWISLSGKVEVRALTAAEVVVGRQTDSDIVLDSRYISRHHAKFIREGKRHSIADLRSTGGTYVNGRRVEYAELRAGDRIGLGRSGIELRYLTAATENPDSIDRSQRASPSGRDC